MDQISCNQAFGNFSKTLDFLGLYLPPRAQFSSNFDNSWCYFHSFILARTVLPSFKARGALLTYLLVINMVRPSNCYSYYFQSTGRKAATLCSYILPLFHTKWRRRYFCSIKLKFCLKSIVLHTKLKKIKHRGGYNVRIFSKTQTLLKGGALNPQNRA